MMNKTIQLPNVEAVQEFVNVAEATGESILVSKEGFRYQVDGASIMGMLAVMGERLRVEYVSESRRFRDMLEKYRAV
jgi:hypothetical protein